MIKIEKLTFTKGDTTKEIEFHSGVNVVYGPSDTGKSFIVSAIDYIFNAKDIDKIKAFDGYETVQAVIEIVDTRYSVTRLVNPPKSYNVEDLSNQPSSLLTFSKDHGAKKSFSKWLLEKMGQSDKKLYKNKLGETVSFTLRKLAYLLIVNENRIIDKRSPYLSSQVVSHTSDYEALKFLITGFDAKPHKDTLKHKVASSENQAFKLKALEEVISILELNEQDFYSNEDEAEILENKIQEERNRHVTQTESLEFHLDQYRELEEHNNNIFSSVRDCNGTIKKFSLLKKHYEADILRLESIVISSQAFSSIKDKTCISCGTELLHQSDDELIQLREATTIEIKKVNSLLKTLDEVIQDKLSEKERLSILKSESINLIEKVKRVIKSEKYNLSENQTNQLTSLLDQRARLLLKKEKSSKYTELFKLKKKLANNSDEVTKENVLELSLPDNILNDLSKVVYDILKDWEFPKLETVQFDEKEKSFIVNDQSIKAWGKGFRAILHSASILGVLKYCENNTLKHPEFIVLDSPLMAYYSKVRNKEDSFESSIAASNLKNKFYEYLIKNFSNKQIIIIENERPSSDVVSKIHENEFTKNESEGRYGLL